MRITATLVKKKNGIYKLKWQEGGQWVEESTRTRDIKEARKRKAERDAYLYSKAYSVPTAAISPLTVTQALDLHFAVRRVADSTTISRTHAVQMFVEHWGNMRVSDLTLSHVLEWRTAVQESERYTVGYINKVVGGFACIFATLRAADKIPYNPIAGIKGLPDGRRDIKFYEWEDALKILDASERPFPFVAHALGFGAAYRLEEIMAAEWQHIHGMEKIWVPGTKTAASGDWIPYHPVLQEWLEPFRKESGPMVVNRFGERPTKREMYLAFDASIVRAGVKRIDGCAWHSERHTCIVHLMDLDYPKTFIARIARHANTKTIDRYMDLRAVKRLVIDRF